jgi:hypothetical protein
LTQLGDVNGDGGFSNADLQFLIHQLQSGAGSSSPAAAPRATSSGTTNLPADSPTAGPPANDVTNSGSVRLENSLIDLAPATAAPNALAPDGHIFRDDVWRRSSMVNSDSKPVELHAAAPQHVDFFTSLGASSESRRARKAIHHLSLVPLADVFELHDLRETS